MFFFHLGISSLIILSCLFSAATSACKKPTTRNLSCTSTRSSVILIQPSLKTFRTSWRPLNWISVRYLFQVLAFSKGCSGVTIGGLRGPTNPCPRILEAPIAHWLKNYTISWKIILFFEKLYYFWVWPRLLSHNAWLCCFIRRTGSASAASNLDYLSYKRRPSKNLNPAPTITLLRHWKKDFWCHWRLHECNGGGWNCLCKCCNVKELMQKLMITKNVESV